MLGRTRMLWCTPCGSHHPADNFSSKQRAAASSCRSCLSHHYKVQAKGHVSMLTGASHQTPSRTVEAIAADRRAVRRSGGKKRARADESGDAESDDDLEGGEAAEEARPGRRVSSPWAPMRAQRPVARALSNRQAALEVSTCRLFGFGSL